MSLYKKEDVARIFDEEKILIGDRDVIPEYRAIEIFGKEAVEFAKRLDNGRNNSNGYGVGDYTLDYLYRNGLNVAATYVNIRCIEDMTTKKVGAAS